MISFLADYGRWALAATGIASAYFVLAATFLEFNGHRWFLFKAVRFRFFRWWRHELTAAQVTLDLCLGVVILPSTLFILFGISILSRSSNSVTSMWYYAIGFTAITAATLWRADATMRAKARERRLMEEESREKERRAGVSPDGDA